MRPLLAPLAGRLVPSGGGAEWAIVAGQRRSQLSADPSGSKGGYVVPSGELLPHELHGMQPVLAVPDVHETLAYYSDKLGFHVDFVAGDPPVHARVCANPTHAAPTVQIRFEPLPPGVSPNPSVYLWLHVGVGLDRLFQTYRSRGVKVVREPEDKPWGLRQFIIEDCNGYLLSYSAEPSTA